MKIHHLASVYVVFSGLILISVPHSSHAGTNMISTNVVGGNTGWFTANIWKTNDGFDLPIGNFATGHPSPGNTYKLVQGPNPAIGNNQNGTRTRNVYTNGVPSIVTFPGDSLELTTNTEIRLKRVAAGNVPTINFPGVGGNPGLILSGGMLNVGDPDIIPIAGVIQAAPGSQSYFCPGNNDGQSVDAARALNIVGQLTGSGTLVIFEGGTNNAQRISGNSNTFSGQWIVKAGWLLGAGTNSLGTNNITLDPNYVLPVPPFSSTAPVTDAAGPAVLEVNYNLNSAGVLTLTSGGNGTIVRLHNNCAFSGVVIDGTPLSAGTHYYSELNANYPNIFPAGGEGAITVQPYGSLPLLLPSVVRQPGAQAVFAGGTAHFTVAAVANTYPPLTYEWRKGGVNLSDGGNVSGVTNATLTISGVSAGDIANYDVLVSNANGPVTSASAALSIVPLSGEPYEGAVAAAGPAAFYQLNEVGDPATNNSPAFDYAGGYNGTYGAAVLNGNPLYNIAGPTAAAGYPGFHVGNKAAQTANANAAARIAIPSLNLNTNTVTITAWINPSGPQNAFNAIFFCRGGGTVAGLNYAGYTDINGNLTLGYHWNGQFETYTWNSGLAAPLGQWSFVALVVTPSNATIHVMNTNGLASASQNFTHIVQSFSGTTLIGDDSGGAAGARVFNGIIDDVAVFNRSLSKTELVAFYTTASAVAAYAPIILGQPASQTLYPGQTAQFKVAGGGSDPLTYQWRAGITGSGVYTNLADGGRISGAATESLTIANINAGDALDYLVALGNSAGSITSSVATLTVGSVGAAETITMTVQQAAGNNWETAAEWSDGQAASVSAVAKPGSTYTLLNGSRMRTPEGPTVTNFPGDMLTLNGNAVWANSPAATVPISEIRFKQATAGTINGRVNFKRLVMNGGQLDVGNDGLLLLGGRIDVLTNAPLYNDGGNDRGYFIDAWLTGAGSIEYRGYTGAIFQPGYRNPLNIAGTSNTFSGKWNIVQGVLLGSAPNSLGTNDITIGTLGALETSYDIANTNGNLFLSGKMFLHQNDTFRSVTVSGVALNQGTYTYAQLAAAYPANFPATWTMQNGSTVSNASGSITVLAQASPVVATQPQSLSLYPSETAQFSVSAVGFQPLSYRWRKNGVNMSDGTTAWGSVISGTATTNLTIANITNNDGANYTVVITNSIGSVTSSVATLTINPVGPPESITMSVVQPGGNDWNTAADWSDGLSASVSALSKPGSTYEVLPGGRLRTPVNAAFSSFPGNILTVSGDGVWLENSPTAAEIRFKHANPGTTYFKKLVLNGGMLDSGDNGVMVIQGQLHINNGTTNSFYADAAAGQDRPFQIDSWLTGGGMIEYHAFGTTFAGNLNVTGTSNTFNGIWHAVQGAILGSAPNSLGTNDIIVEAAGAVETSYNINNPQGSLILNGQMFLHQNNTFRAVNVAGTDLAPGTYSFATLNSTYPANFPATWPLQIGSSVNTGSGSITVLGNVVPRPTLGAQTSGNQVTITWTGNFWLVEADEVTGPWVTNAAATSPFPVTPSLPRKFYGLQPK